MMTPAQKKRFQKICDEMEALINELHSGEHPDAVLFLAGGCVSLYDWPGALVEKPDVPMVAHLGIWPKAGGG